MSESGMSECDDFGVLLSSSVMFLVKIELLELSEARGHGPPSREVSNGCLTLELSIMSPTL